MFFVLHHMDRTKNDLALKELNRVLRKGGLVFIAEDIVLNDEERTVAEFTDRKLNAEIVKKNAHNYLGSKEWSEIFVKHGFQVKEYNEIKPDKVKHGFFVLEKITKVEEKSLA